MFNKGLIYSISTVFFIVLSQLFFIRYASYGIEKFDYGKFVLLQTFIAGLASLFLQSPGHAFERFYNEAKNKLEFINEFRTLILMVNIPVFFIIFLYGYIFDQIASGSAFLLFLWFFFMSNYTVNQRLYLISLKRKEYFYLQMLEANSKFILPILFYIYFNTLESLLFGIALGYFISFLIVIVLMSEYKFRFNYNNKNLKKYFFYSSPIILVGIFTWATSFSDRYFIEYFLTTEDVAIYSILSMIAGMGALIGSIYNIYAEPKILKEFSINIKNSYKMINKYMKILVLVFFLLFVLILFMPEKIWTILLEPDIINNEYYFITMLILIIAIFINILHIALRIYLKLFKSLNVLALILFISFIINFAGNFFVSKYGIIAAAISTLLAYSSILIMEIAYIKITLKKQNKT